MALAVRALRPVMRAAATECSAVSAASARNALVGVRERSDRRGGSGLANARDHAVGATPRLARLFTPLPAGATAAAAFCGGRLFSTFSTVGGGSSSSNCCSAQFQADERKRQVDFMANDMCILVDEHDAVVGPASKRDCHRRPGTLHRAFSLFIVDPASRRVLLQQRSSHKLTFPSMWTNACCSHPLHVPAEMCEAGSAGVRAAARRKSLHELGVDIGASGAAAAVAAGRVLYQAQCAGDDWAEFEMDHVLVLFQTGKTLPKVALDQFNIGEVASVRWADEATLDKEMRDCPQSFTPWFRLMWQHTMVQRWFSGEAVESDEIIDMRSSSI